MKRYIKVFSLLLVSFILSGCSIDYNIYFNEDYIDETISGKISNDLLSDETIQTETEGIVDEGGFSYKNYLSDSMCAIANCNDEFYTFESNTGNDFTKFKFNYKYDYDQFEDSNIFKNCFSNIIYKNTDETLYINITGEYYCELLEDVNINISSKNKLNCNGKKKDKSCSYSINSDNKENLDIEVQIYKNREKLLNTFDYIVITLILIICGSIWYMKKKQNK